MSALPVPRNECGGWNEAVRVQIVRVTTSEQREACAELLEADPELGHLDVTGMELWAALDEEGTLLGMAGADWDPESRHMEMQCCVVAPHARGKGIQQRLIRARIAFARKNGAISLETYAHSANLPSLVSLLKCGFQPKDLQDGFLTVSYPLV